MPLVILVLFIVFLFVSANDSNKKYNREITIREKDKRKTNAKMERKLVDYYMKYGFSFDEAFKKSYEDMVAAGYDPCIPRNAYEDNYSIHYQSSFCDCPWKYDSSWVKQRKEVYAEADVYRNFPKNDIEWSIDLKRQSLIKDTIPVGEYLIYPGLGTCEVIDFINLGTVGYYTLKVLSTGEILRNTVKIGDPRITRQGKN